MQGSIFNIFLGVSQTYPAKFFYDLFFSVTVVDQMVLGAVGCPARIHCTAVFTLRNGKFSRLVDGSPRDVPMGGAAPPIFSNLQESWSKKLARQQEGWPQYFL